jgi:hypothetical protein
MSNKLDFGLGRENGELTKCRVDKMTGRRTSIGAEKRSFGSASNLNIKRVFKF